MELARSLGDRSAENALTHLAAEHATMAAPSLAQSIHKTIASP
jgi:hypothetical protein